MNSVLIGTHQMDSEFGLFLPDYKIPSPVPQTKFIEIIGRDGSLDLSNAFGVMHYKSREWNLEFKHFDPVNWHTISSNVLNAIHGQRLNFTFDDDPNYQWTGRVIVDSYSSRAGEGTLKVKIVSDPYKMKKTASTVTSNNGSATMNNQGSLAVVPSVTATAEATLEWTVQGQSYAYTMNAGTSIIPQLTLYPGSTVVTVTSTANVTFTWTEGSL